jgi:glutamine synthetase
MPETPDDPASHRRRLEQTLQDQSIRQVRLGWGDQHGIVRSKTVTTREFLNCLDSGKDFPSLTIFDTTNHPILYPFTGENDLGLPGISGLPDNIVVPDPSTYRKLPWLDGTAWVLGDMRLQDGEPDPLCTRQFLKRQVARMNQAGFEPIVGLEVEFHIFKVTDPALTPDESGKPPMPPAVSNLTHGYQYLSENRTDELEDVLAAIRSALLEMELPLAGLDAEWGPSQCEITFEPMTALAAADAMLLLRTAIKQICRRRGLHATFMTFPKIANVMPSGWHLHQSLNDGKTGTNAFIGGDGPNPLSDLGMRYLAGLLAHAAGTSILTTPTINGYKRYRPDSLAPCHVNWGCENRSTMLRIVGARQSRSIHIENRIGEPCANPYLYIASQIVSGLDGIERNLEAGPQSSAGYQGGQRLPRSLMDAIAAFKQDDVLQAAFGRHLSTYLVALKEFEVGRFLSSVTDWEHQEYFEVY